MNPDRKHGLKRVCRTLLDAVNRGAPVYNDGDPAACYAIYQSAARAVTGSPLDGVGADGPLSDRIQQLARTAASLAPDSEGGFRSAAWDLRHGFDALIGEAAKQLALEAMEWIPELEAREAPTETRLRDLMVNAIESGSIAFNNGQEPLCARLYCATAVTLARLARAADERRHDRFLAAVERALGEFGSVSTSSGTDHSFAVEFQAIDFSWALRRAFDDWLCDLGMDMHDTEEIRPGHAGRGAFICYAHEDSGFVEQLTCQLAPFRRAGTLNYWLDRQIEPGARWEQEIEDAIRGSAIAVLMVSPSFLASDFICREELPRIARQEDAGEMAIVPLHVRPSAYDMVSLPYTSSDGTPAELQLASLQAFNDPDCTMEEMSSPERSRLCVQVIDHLLLTCEPGESPTEHDGPSAADTP